MGQGTESCGGYEVEYDPYDDDHIVKGEWTQRDGRVIKLADMSLRHLYNSREVCNKAARRATFTDTSDKWEAWADAFSAEISRRETPVLRTRDELKNAPPGRYTVTGEAAAEMVTRVLSQIPPAKVRGTQIEMKCHCGEVYNARLADLNRGWGLSCSVRCASIRKAYHKPAATRTDGKPLPKRKSKR